MFSTIELFLIVSQAILCLSIIIYNFAHRDRFLFLSPITLFLALHLYYYVIGPSVRVVTGDTFVDLIDFRHHMQNGWICSLVSLIFLLLGYYITNIKSLAYRFVPVDEKFYAHRFFWTTLLASLSIFGLMYLGFQIGFNPFNSNNNFITDTRLAGGSLWGYFYFTINFSTAFILIYTISYWKHPYCKILILVFIITALCLFINIGFRGRIVFMFTALFISYHILNNKRVGFILLVLSSALVLFASTVIVLTRQYLSGIQIDMLSQYSLNEIVINSFQDSVIFLTMSAVIDYYPHVFSFIYFDPFYYTAILPIPRTLWLEKPFPEYLLQIGRIHGYDGSVTGGQAVPNIGEYYMMFGWYGVAFFSFLLGCIYKTLWNWFSFNRRSKLACVFYALVCSMIFPLMSRGYFAQFFMELFFNTSIAFLIIFIYSNKYQPKYR